MKNIKCLFLLFLISTIIVISGCHTTHKPVTFSTSYGEIKKGASIAEVMAVLGNPNDIYVSPQDNSEVWCYDLIEESTLVYFLNKEVIKVVREEDAFPTPFGDIRRDAAKEEVEEMLGEPYQRSFSKNFDIWYYDCGGNIRLFVFFKDDHVTSVWQKQGLKRKGND